MAAAAAAVPAVAAGEAGGERARPERLGWPFKSSLPVASTTPDAVVLWSVLCPIANRPATWPPAEGGAQPRELSFVNSRGERLQGLLLDAGSEDVVILCHGCVASKGANHAQCA